MLGVGHLGGTENNQPNKQKLFLRQRKSKKSNKIQFSSAQGHIWRGYKALRAAELQLDLCLAAIGENTASREATSGRRRRSEKCLLHLRLHVLLHLLLLNLRLLHLRDGRAGRVSPSAACRRSRRQRRRIDWFVKGRLNNSAELLIGSGSTHESPWLRAGGAGGLYDVCMIIEQHNELLRNGHFARQPLRAHRSLEDFYWHLWPFPG